jgi:hypothetical protein
MIQILSAGSQGIGIATKARGASRPMWNCKRTLKRIEAMSGAGYRLESSENQELVTEALYCALTLSSTVSASWA